MIATLDTNVLVSGTLFGGTPGVIVSPDPADNAIIDCAVEAMADAIVSGDAHLTELKKVAGIPVVMPAQFLEMLD